MQLPEPVKAKQVYAGLRSKLSAVVKQEGFKPSKLSPLAWTRPLENEHLSFWFQLDKNGWFDALGSRFTLEFQVGPEPHQPSDFQNRVRYFPLLPPPDQEWVRLHNNRVCRSLPELDSAHPLYDSMKILRSFDDNNQRELPYSGNEDVWLRYFLASDIDELGDFLSQRFSALLAAFLSRP